MIGLFWHSFIGQKCRKPIRRMTVFDKLVFWSHSKLACPCSITFFSVLILPLFFLSSAMTVKGGRSNVSSKLCFFASCSFSLCEAIRPAWFLNRIFCVLQHPPFRVRVQTGSISSSFSPVRARRAGAASSFWGRPFGLVSSLSTSACLFPCTANLFSLHSSFNALFAISISASLVCGASASGSASGGAAMASSGSGMASSPPAFSLGTTG